MRYHVETRQANGTRGWERRWSTVRGQEVAFDALREIAKEEWVGILLRIASDDGYVSNSRHGERSA
jgi:hypothetical protein